MLKKNLKAIIQKNKIILAAKYFGPGFIVTVGFIDPGNWAANLEAGSQYGYQLLWVVLVSTIMLIFLQNNAAKLGIVSGLSLAQATKKYLSPKCSKLVLITALLATIATALAEILGGGLALQMLTGINYRIGTILVGILGTYMICSNSYGQIEKWMIGFVSLIGLSFLYNLTAVNLSWPEIIQSTIIISIPNKSAIIIIMSVLGAVVMPHNLFIHSETIKSRNLKLRNTKLINQQLKYANLDTIISMIIGFLINAAIIILAATTFYANNQVVTEINQASELLVPILGKTAAQIFALAFLFAGISSSLSAIMTGGIVTAGMKSRQYNINEKSTKIGVIVTVISSIIITFLINEPYQGLILSQVFLSIQLPITIICLIYITSLNQSMGIFKNNSKEKIILIIISLFVIILNIFLLGYLVYN